MQFPPSVPVRGLPANAAAWARVANQTCDNHFAAWGPDLLVNVHVSNLTAALPTLGFVSSGVGGQRRLPLNAIIFFLGRFGWVEDSSLAADLASGLSAAILASFEAWAVRDGRLNWTPTSEAGFLQRVLALEAELSTGMLPAELKVTADSFVPFIGHDDTAGGGPDWADSWQSRMTVASLIKHRVLGPAAECSAAELPKVTVPSLAAFHQPDRYLATEGFGLSGDTAPARIGAIGAREVRDTKIERAAPYRGAGGGSGGGGGSGEKKLNSRPTRNRVCTSRCPSRWCSSGSAALTWPARSPTRSRRSPPRSAWRPSRVRPR